MDYPKIRKLSLKIFIGFLAITAFIAIIALLSGSSDPVTGKTLLTCLTVCGASICSMSCAAFLEKRKKPAALGFAGIVLSIIAARIPQFGEKDQVAVGIRFVRNSDESGFGMTQICFRQGVIYGELGGFE